MLFKLTTFTICPKTIRMDYLKEIESIINDLKGSDEEAATRLKEIYEHSFTSTELLMGCTYFLLEIKEKVSPVSRGKILKLKAFCNSIGLFPGE